MTTTRNNRQPEHRGPAAPPVPAPIPGAQTERLARGLARSVAGYCLARGHLTQTAVMAAAVTSPHTAAAIAQREQEHRQALSFLRRSAVRFLAHLDAEDRQTADPAR